MTKAFFVTGTDTDVGKTFVSCALLNSAEAKGLSTMALKPLAAGCEQIDGQWQNEDARLLQAHMNMNLPYVQVNPVALKAAASPHIAAALEERTVTVARVDGICRGALMNRPDFALIEGAGGWRVPISPRETMADLAKQLAFPVILVVNLRLGCLNHALLTAEAIRRDGLVLAAWVGNRTSPECMDYEDDNIATLVSALGAPLLGCLPFKEHQTPETISNYLSLDCLDL